MKKYPKYIVMPVALLIYFICMTLDGLKRNEWRLQDDFWTICVVEFVIIAALFFTLRYLQRKRDEMK